MKEGLLCSGFVQNLKHLNCARESIKGKGYAGVLGVDGATAALVSQAEVVDEILD
jgi:hypothetical protein